VHQPALRQVVILDRAVLRRAIVPHQQITDLPLVAADEGNYHLDSAPRFG
jgi:hypothetical protein